MASKFGLAGGIPERRVRPIWDAVDSRQFKSALKLSVALLAKYPNSPYALALKALILERMGKPDEALAVCINAKELLYSSDVVQIDDLTLSTLQIVFQRLDRLDLATSCYEHACGKYPNNLEIMMGLFNCYVREYSYVKQQQTAIKMYKIVGEERFLMWAVCSIQLQVICGSGGEKLLALAEALLRKHISSHNLHEPEALVIYISILEQQGKYGDALEVLSGDLGSLIGMEVDKFRMQGRLLARSCDYSAAAEVFQKVLQLCPDDWEAFLHYLRCLLEDNVYWSKVSTADQLFPSNAVGFQTSKSIHLTDEVFDSRISSALSFVQKLQMEVLSDHVRGPYLANIEIERQCRLNGRTDDGKLMELLLTYFDRFSHLSCFTSDVEMFLPVLKHSEKVELLDTFVKLSESTSMPPVKKLGQTITIFKIQELFGGRFSIPLGELETIAVNMVEVYCKNLVLSRNLDPQENMHGEELLSMASNVLVQLYWRTSYFGYLLEAIMVLEFGLIIRRYIWQYKIHLLHLYSHMGALPLAYQWYGTLEVKNILLESVSHHILPQMLRSPLWTETTDFLREYRRFMDDYLREAADLTYLAYRHRNYSKVIEFVKFKERLQHSHQYLMSSLDESVLQLKQKSDSLEDVEDILEHFNCGTQLLELSSEEKLKFLTFNEDFQARPWWSPMPDINYLLEPFEGPPVEFRMSSFKDQDLEKEHVRKVIKQKSVLPRLVYLSIKIASSCLKENVQPNGSVSDTDSTSELKFLLEGYARNSGLSFDDAIGVIVEISKGYKSFKDCGSDVAYWVSFAVFVNAWNLRSRHLGFSDGVGYNSWHIVNNLFEKYIAEHLKSAGPILTSPGRNLPVLVQLITESVSWHILVIQSYITSLLPPGRKKKKGSVADQLNSPELQAIRDSIHCSINVIRLIQNWLTNQIKRPEDECVDVLLSHLHTKEGEEGPGRVLQILERTASASSQEFGLRISGALQSWSSATVARKIASAQSKVLSMFHQICDSKLRALELLKQSI